MSGAARLIPEPDELYSVLEWAFRMSSSASRALVHRESPDIAADARSVLARIAGDCAPQGVDRPVDCLLGVLWELSAGEWSVAAGLLERAGRPRREDVLQRLADALGRLRNRAPAEGPSLTPARARLLECLEIAQWNSPIGSPPVEETRRDERGWDLDSLVPVSRFVARPSERVLEQLRSLPGLDSARTEVEQLVALIRVERARSREGLPVTASHPHLALAGPPGTGKTTFARLFAELLYSSGRIAEARFVEVGRGSLVGRYVGSTTQRVAEVFACAEGGVLFIDEAYSLVGDSFACEAVAELVRQMENQRGQTVVILAGYPAEMQELMSSNPGLSSRIGCVVEFSDFNTADLVEVATLSVGAHGYLLTPDAELALAMRLDRMRDDPSFGNARTVRAVVDEAIRRHALRVAASDEMTGDSLFVLDVEDIAAHPLRETVCDLAPVHRPGYL